MLRTGDGGPRFGTSAFISFLRVKIGWTGGDGEGRAFSRELIAPRACRTRDRGRAHDKSFSSFFLLQLRVLSFSVLLFLSAFQLDQGRGRHMLPGGVVNLSVQSSSPVCPLISDDSEPSDHMYSLRHHIIRYHSLTGSLITLMPSSQLPVPRYALELIPTSPITSNPRLAEAIVTDVFGGHI